jgi:hypothetical protein
LHHITTVSRTELSFIRLKRLNLKSDYQSLQ